MERRYVTIDVFTDGTFGTAGSVYVGGQCVKVMRGSLFLPGAI
jgi:hypothetical protein